MKTILGLLFTALMIFSGCDSGFSPQKYFPLDKDFKRAFSGPWQILEVAKVTRLENSKQFFVHYIDTLATSRVESVYIEKNKNVFWQALDPGLEGLPEFQFSPPLLQAPFSNKIGDRFCMQSVEIRTDTSETRYRINVCYEIESVAPISVPAGEYTDCIQMRVNYSYIDIPEIPYLEGESRWWFVEHLGPVRFELNRVVGVLMPLD